MAKFVAYLDTGAYTPGGEVFGVGNATRDQKVAASTVGIDLNFTQGFDDPIHAFR